MYLGIGFSQKSTIHISILKSLTGLYHQNITLQACMPHFWGPQTAPTLYV